MKITLHWALTAAAMMGCVSGCGFGRPFQPAGWDCRVFRYEFSNDLDSCSLRTVISTPMPPEAEPLMSVVKDPFLESTL